MNDVSRKIFTVLLIFFVSVQADAQFLKKLKEKAQKEILKNIAAKDEESVKEESAKKEKESGSTDNSNRAQDNNIQEDSLSSTPPDFSQLQSLFGKPKSDVKIKEEYIFEGEVIYEITGGNTDSIQYTYLFNKKETYYGMKINMSKYGTAGNSIILFENGNVISFIDSQGMKMYMVAPKEEENGFKNLQSDYDNSQLRKTGKTKTILGYSSVEYGMTDGNKNITAWASTSLDIPNPYMSTGEEIPIEGHILEYIVVDDNNSFAMKAIVIDKSKSYTLKTSDFKNGF